MEKIKFKPSLEIENKLLLTGIILLFTIFLSFIGIIIIIIALVLIVRNKYRSYSINNENEIQEDYKFIIKSTKIHRIDQITSLVLHNGILEKIFGLGSIEFGVFGKNDSYLGIENNNNYNNHKNLNFGQVLVNLKEYKNIFFQLNKLIGVSLDEEIIYEEKPSTKPVKFFLFTFLSLFISSMAITVFLNSSNSILVYMFDVWFFIFSIITFIISLKIKSTKFSITNNYIKCESNYILGKEIQIIPLSKITNHQINKNIFSYSLFKVGYLKIFTGGTNDPIFHSLKNFKKFNNILNDLLQNYKNNIKIPNNSYNENRVNKSNTINKEKVLFQTKPGISFLITLKDFIYLIIGIIIVLIQSYFMSNNNTVILILIYLIYLIYRILLFKNTKYEFYEDKVITIDGVFNITKKEIYYKNIKHLKLERKFLFEKLFNQGTIYIYTPGTGSVDNKIKSIKKFNEIYNEFKEVIF